MTTETILCKCEEMTCKEGCNEKHTHKTFWCEKCHPERYENKSHIADIGKMETPKPRGWEESLINEYATYLSGEPADGGNSIEETREYLSEFKEKLLLSKQQEIINEAKKVSLKPLKGMGDVVKIVNLESIIREVMGE